MAVETNVGCIIDDVVVVGLVRSSGGRAENSQLTDVSSQVFSP